MMLRGTRVGVAGRFPVVLILGVACTVTTGRAADKAPAAKPVWSAETKYDLVRLDAGAGGKVVFARDGKKLTGLNTADGSMKYQRTLDGFEEKGFWGRFEDGTFVYSTSKELVGVDVLSGQDRWHASPGDGFKMEARVTSAGNPRAYLTAWENGVAVWDIAKGKVLWSAKEPLNGDLVPSAWARKDDPESGVLVFLDRRTVFIGTDGKELWSAADTGNKRRGGQDVVLSSVNAFGRLLLVHCSKQVVLLNNATGEVLASETFPSPEAAADVEAFQLESEGQDEPLLLSLGGRLVIADAKAGKVLGKSPENSILGQVAASRAGGGDDLVVMTAVRGSDKTPNVGMHLYRVSPATGEVKWHAYNGGTVDTRQVLRNVVGEKVNGPYYLDQAKGVLLATDGRGVRLYDWDGGKERWAADLNLPNSYKIMMYGGSNSFAIIRSMTQNRIYMSTNPRPVEGPGVIYVAGKDEVHAIDAATGKERWTSKSKGVSLISGLAAGGDAVIFKEGLLRDANDFGARTTIVTEFGAATYVEEPEVYIDENPYGFVGLEAATGKEQWKCTDFEGRDYAMMGPMPKDASVCDVVKVQKEKGCKPSKLGIGGILSTVRSGDATVLLGKGGVAGVQAGSCAAAWKVDGSVKKLAKIHDLDAHDDSAGLFQTDTGKLLIAHYGNEVSVVDVAAGKVLFSAGKADVVKVLPSAKLLFTVDGNSLSTYQLP